MLSMLPLFPGSPCTTLPTWRCTTSASPHSRSSSTAWLSSTSPWRHSSESPPCTGVVARKCLTSSYTVLIKILFKCYNKMCMFTQLFVFFPPHSLRDIAKNSLLRWPVFLYWTCLGVFDAVIFFFGAYFLFDNTTFTSNGQVSVCLCVSR